MSADAIPEEKESLRQELKRRLRGMSVAERELASERLRGKLAVSPAFSCAEHILLFAALPSEPDLLPLVREYADQKCFYFPRVTPDGLTLHRVHAVEELVVRGKIREPVEGTAAASLAQIQLILVPGLAFSREDGARLGRGGGYYDRLLADPYCQALALGVCFQVQLVKHIPQEPHDHGVMGVYTESAES
jgi:5-formyltetrahydrofolate cyclo-ligase